jgi:hypothetical protein
VIKALSPESSYSNSSSHKTLQIFGDGFHVLLETSACQNMLLYNEPPSPNLVAKNDITSLAFSVGLELEKGSGGEIWLWFCHNIAFRWWLNLDQQVVRAVGDRRFSFSRSSQGFSIWSFCTGRYYSLDLECSPRAFVFKAWSPAYDAIGEVM